tara:strand:+ start:6991 stop:7326 length:336 start_codon:yes stop_codon:yes gene_type:complete
MKYLTQYVKSDITQHAKSELPNECCGIIYESDNEYKSKRCINSAGDKRNNFRITAAQYIEASKLGKIIAYYHSHTEDKIGVFSDADKKVSRAHGLPLVMYCVSNEKFLEYI